MNRSKLALAVVLALTAAGAGTTAALAYGDGPKHGARLEARFAEMDADKDGKVSAAEMRAYRDARFANADANGDGKLSVEELDNARKAERLERLQKMMVWLDTDGDGMLSADEFDPRKGAMLSRLDADGDGALSMEEMGDAKMRFHHRQGEPRHDGAHKRPMAQPDAKN